MQTLAKTFYERTDEAINTITATFRQEGCGYRTWGHPVETGIKIEFLFRSETDYSLIVPYEYCEDQEKIRDYYKRFQLLLEPISCISDIQPLADAFFYNELSKISTPKLAGKI
jgi:hypothetical protein